tara:strand:- start:50 stop:244 length:195 start_codon:yes stop_codon:yes gene_type:complete
MAKTIKLTEAEGYIKELQGMIQIALDCLDDIVSTQANSAAYRDMAKSSLEKILLRNKNAVSNES